MNEINMDNQKHSFEDLILDESFVKWVKNPDYELNLYWEQWIKHNHHRWNDILLAREFILRINFKTTQPSGKVTKRVFNKIIDNTRGNKKSYREENNGRRPGYRMMSSARPSGYYVKIAAVLLIIVLSAGCLYLIYKQNQAYLVENQAIARITKSNPSSIRSKIKLPDGTKVWLNAASEISYPEKFGNVREVQLKGEAYFEVVKNAEAPFIVHTPLAVVKVLGTSFNVNAYEDDREDFISLVSGRVKISTVAGNEKFLLVPGEQLAINSTSGVVETRLFDEKEVRGWTEGWLAFKNANKDEIIRKLERWYDVTITVVNEPAEEWNINGYFRDQSLELVLDRLSFSKGFTYKIEGRSVLITF